MSGERKRGFIRPGADDATVTPQKWGLPDYGADTHKAAKQTAFNYDPGWIPHFDEPEQEAAHELTEEEIALIRSAAQQEGFEQGLAEGYQQGLEQGKAEGLQAGHQEGHAQGYQEGVAEGQALIQEHVQTFMALANQFAQPLDLLNAQVEKQLVDMVLALTKEVVHVEVQTNPQVILDTVKASVESLPIAGHAITLKLNPEDVEIIRQAYGEQEIETRNWTLLSEPALSRGDVQIEAGESSVSYRMEDRVRSVLKSFCGVNRHHPGE
ncbi:flagellar assembly protein H [Vibrio mimicus]|uniref:flagellar assembly protein FliH n=1 Tax=Vibrio mimicus TaxID=674 RepID=UPI0002BA3DA9|nr:flagellar assembly protein FliH [Vibrio mimicus]EMB48563.1 Flagellar assembly protein FliH [Vibrio mimicus CAIM 602]MBY7674226.1 flagellar assembly protein FliH [Vibrio mimicus]MBY7725810.1 flagellar assembly protein FliH [Vibrio mimicus]SUP12044.1 flagellar assembly protein H [Vibrio mimicus]